MAEGGFKVKTIVTSGTNHPYALSKMGPVLGHRWEPLSDQIFFDHINDIKLKVKRKEVKISRDMLHDLQFSPRLALALVSQQFDPAGLLCPLTIKLKIALRRVVALKLD